MHHSIGYFSRDGFSLLVDQLQAERDAAWALDHSFRVPFDLDARRLVRRPRRGNGYDFRLRNPRIAARNRETALLVANPGIEAGRNAGERMLERPHPHACDWFASLSVAYHSGNRPASFQFEGEARAMVFLSGSNSAGRSSPSPASIGTSGVSRVTTVRRVSTTLRAPRPSA